MRAMREIGVVLNEIDVKSNIFASNRLISTYYDWMNIEKK